MNRKQRRAAAKAPAEKPSVMQDRSDLQHLEDALAHHQAGRLGEAEAGYLHVLARYPKDVGTLSNLGLALDQQGRRDAAIEIFTGALELQPDHLNTLMNLGMSLHNAGRWAEAEVRYKAAISLKPDSTGLQTNLGVALHELGRFDEAIAALRVAVSIDPASAVAWSNLGKASRSAANPVDAEAAYRRAIGLQPSTSEFHSDLGTVLLAQNRFDEAVAALRQAITLDPKNALAHVNLGKAFLDLNRLDDALPAFEHAVAVRPDYGEGHFGIGQVLLTKGDFPRGWSEYEWRWRTAANLHHTYHSLVQPLWQGEPIAGKTILLHNEQGLGDNIQFIRYVPQLVETGASVLLLAPPSLRRLFSDLPGVTLVPSGEPSPPFHVRCSLLSLPRVFGTTLNTIPSRVPYLSVAAADTKGWADRLPDARLRVGLAWAGNPQHSNDHNRSIGLRRLAPLFEIEGVTMVSLQKEPPAADRATLADLAGRVETVALDDVYDTASLVSALDLVISVDTSVCHLAGALGRPTWLLLPFAPDWRWLLDREDSPWYPTMRLFRQRQPADWTDVVDRLAAALTALVATTRTSPSAHPRPTGDNPA